MHLLSCWVWLTPRATLRSHVGAAEVTHQLCIFMGLSASSNFTSAGGHCHHAVGSLCSAKLTLPNCTGSEPGRRAGCSNTKTGHRSPPAVCIRWILSFRWLSLLAVCCVYSYTADGSFKTEKLKNITGDSPTSALFGESFLQFFHCQSQLRDVCYGEDTHEKDDKHMHARELQ